MADWKDSIVLLTSSEPANEGFGTGFVFHRDGAGRSFLLTCKHVVETLQERPKGGVGEPPGLLAAGKPAEVWATGDRILDLAVLAVDGLTLTPLPLGKPAGRGRSIETAGFTALEQDQQSVVPRPLDGTILDNNPVWSRFPARIGAWSLDIKIEAELFRELTEGYSGSPVRDRETGEIVGIMNLRRRGTEGHALCVRSCDLFDPPLATRLLDYPLLGGSPLTPSGRPSRAVASGLSAAAEGALDWLASTIDHRDPIERVARCLDDAREGANPGLWFYAFHACYSDCPRALAEHLAVRFGALNPRSPWLEQLVTELEPDRFDEHGLWKALVAKLSPPDAERLTPEAEADLILDWVNADPPAGAGRLRVVYSQLTVAEQGHRIPGFVAGAFRDFSALRGIDANARVLFLFGCIFEESGLRGFLARLRPPRLDPLKVCEPLGALSKLTLMDVDAWLTAIGQPNSRGPRLDPKTLDRLRDALEQLFASDATRVRYRAVYKPAHRFLTQASLSDPKPGDPG